MRVFRLLCVRSMIHPAPAKIERAINHDLTIPPATEQATRRRHERQYAKLLHEDSLNGVLVEE